MPKVSVKTTIHFLAESQFVSGRLTNVKEQFNSMFGALERFEKDRGIELYDIQVKTREGSGVGPEYKYIISAQYIKSE